MDQEDNSSNKWPIFWINNLTKKMQCKAQCLKTNTNLSFFQTRAATTNVTQFWPGGIVYFVIDASLEAHREMIFDAFNEYHQHTCIQFRKCKQCAHYLKLEKANNSEECSSNVGLIKTENPQTLNLGTGCLYLGTVIHELAHSLGLIHEHQRPDSPDHIVINWEYIQFNKFDQFNLTKNAIALTPFDVHAITIYEDTAFTKNKTSNDRTITPKNRNVTLPNSSDKPGLSELDIVGLNKLYNCTTVDTNSQ